MESNCQAKYEKALIRPSLYTVVVGMLTLGDYNRIMNEHNYRAHHDFTVCHLNEVRLSVGKGR